MIFNDITNRLGIIQECEALCALGLAGITGDTALFKDFARWSNKWNQIGLMVAIEAMNGWDPDDPAYQTYPSGYFVGTTSRSYAFGSDQHGDLLRLLAIKSIGLTRDGSQYLKARPIDSTDLATVKADANIDSLVPAGAPCYDPKGGSIDIFPKFTAAEVAAGAKVYMEFFREPKAFGITGTDAQEPAFASLFHHLIAIGASFEYAKLNLPNLAAELKSEIYGTRGRYGATEKGLLADMESWYAERYPRPRRMKAKQESNK